jgi:hypothetical protein
LVKYIIEDVEFLVPPQYEIKKVLGSGKTRKKNSKNKNKVPTELLVKF